MEALHYREGGTMLGSCPTPWKPLYEKTLQETDNVKLAQNVLELEEAMMLRALELGNSPEDFMEIAAMKRTATELLKIKTEKLGWPGI
jgi:hypothetical protein